jgi:DNA polymerase-3 subunit gamma/tau
MTYQVLARKWRPRSFATLVGQDHVVRALSNALTQQRLHHAYLFTGTRGVGKTTLARILAKALNCDTGITATPCGVCSACTEIDAGRFVDLIEVDAATNTKVEEMRQLLENAVYVPSRGRFKVYVIDEVHMLSTSAFNAMLKTLEEPPEHIKFILATTDPQKIPVTVLSRCLQFNLKQMSPQSIVGHLEGILNSEGVAADAMALSLIAKAAHGSMRDALSLLDQAIAYGGGALDGAAVRGMLGTVDDDFLFLILDALTAKDGARMVELADEMAGKSLSFESALAELASLLQKIALAQAIPGSAPNGPDRARIEELAGRLDAEEVQLCYQIAIRGRDDMPLAPDPYAGFIMTLLRMLAFTCETDGPGPAPARATAPATSAPAKAKPASSAAPAAGVAPTVEVPAHPAAPRNGVGHAAVAPAPAATRSAPAPGGGASRWDEMLGALGISGIARELARHCELVSVDDAAVTLRLADLHQHLAGKLAQDKIQAALCKHLQRNVRLTLKIGAPAGITPAAKEHSEKEARQARAVASIEQDSFVREMVETFDARISDTSIKPV